MCQIARIDRFLGEWDQAEFGPAHIVLSDCNIDDLAIDSCLAALDYLIDGTWSESYRSRDDFASPEIWALWVEESWPGEHEATRAFLREFRAIPEDERIAPGDVQCFDPDESFP